MTTHRLQLDAPRRRPFRGRNFRGRNFRGGISFLEMLLAMGGIGLVLVLLVLVTNSVRADNAEYQTRHTLRTLRQALLRYQADTGAMPPGPTHQALATLLAHRNTEPLVRTLRLDCDAEGRITIADGYGRPVRYKPPATSGGGGTSGGSGGRVDFFSAGADGRYGDLKSANPADHRAVSDNLYGADLETPLP